MQNEFNLSAASTLALFDTTKAQRATFVESVISSVLDGERNALDIHIHLKNMEEICKSVKDDPRYKSEVVDAAYRQIGGAKVATYHNAKVEVRELGTKYDYSVCNDRELESLQKMFNSIETQLKERQEFLRKVPASGMTYVHPEDGDVYTIYPPAKSSTTGVVVSLK
jgi:hypothetical protein